ncbi:MAG: hypothetical protein PHS93_01770 [Candidatus Omnitrophica bacterium]|nr:hypothetical protein [Candidatus Omnitrophota bacterium]MDD5351880.1 hypothetical protein [Candidatus Omnitrophota bacterium]MDD5550706.1 hypothetical protein [Candidatus Omnitrophota bacterium]
MKLEIERKEYYRVFLLLGSGIIMLFIFLRLFEFREIANSYNFYRLVWCFSFTCLGLSMYGLQSRKGDVREVIWTELCYDFVILILISAIVFSCCHLSEKSSGYIFYHISAAASFMGGYLKTYFWDLIKKKLKI